jgi:DNA-binding transcriptional ArsR family regulator
MEAMKTKIKPAEVASHGVRKKTARLAKTIKRASSILKIVGDPTRLDILLTLSEHELSISVLCTAIHQNQTALSHHLALLRHRKLIQLRREGNQTVYSLTREGSRIASCLRTLISSTIDSSLLQEVGGFVLQTRSLRAAGLLISWEQPMNLG